jgi:hypothetical protein
MGAEYKFVGGALSTLPGALKCVNETNARAL